MLLLFRTGPTHPLTPQGCHSHSSTNHHYQLSPSVKTEVFIPSDKLIRANTIIISALSLYSASCSVSPSGYRPELLFLPILLQVSALHSRQALCTLNLSVYRSASVRIPDRTRRNSIISFGIGLRTEAIMTFAIVLDNCDCWH